MGTLYLVRHGETQANETGILQGHLDTPLTKRGRDQARLVGSALKDVPLDAVYSSDLGRAVETAKLITGGRKIPLYTDERLREVHCGLFQGMTKKEAQERWPEEFELLHLHPITHRRPGGESFQDLYNRVTLCLENIAAGAFRHVCVVSHGGAVKCMMAHVKGKPVDPSSAVFANCSISIITFEGGRWHVVKENDRGHLEGLSGPTGDLYSW